MTYREMKWKDNSSSWNYLALNTEGAMGTTFIPTSYSFNHVCPHSTPQQIPISIKSVLVFTQSPLGVFPSRVIPISIPKKSNEKIKCSFTLEGTFESKVLNSRIELQ